VRSDQRLGTVEKTHVDLDAKGEEGSLALDQHRVEKFLVACDPGAPLTRSVRQLHTFGARDQGTREIREHRTGVRVFELDL
jgi:hypothetical protein